MYLKYQECTFCQKLTRDVTVTSKKYKTTKKYFKKNNFHKKIDVTVTVTSKNRKKQGLNMFKAIKVTVTLV